MIHRVPTDLPHARLYLDDIEDISNILQEATFKSDRSGMEAINAQIIAGYSDPGKAQEVREYLASERPTVTKISYTIGQRKMDSIIDLQTLGGSTVNLSIEVDSQLRTVSLNFKRYSNPTLYLSSFKDEEAFATFGKIKSILDRRQLHIKNAIENLPVWLKVLALSLLIGGPAILNSMFLSNPQQSRYSVSPYFIIGFLGSWCISLMPAYQYFLNPSRVFFVRSHERTRASSEARRRTAREIIFLIVGAVIGGLITESIRHFLFKLP